ncbi:glycoside hydrolase [Neocallimastix lanati (nom. inval.)]|jgi:GH25 family lysozyme M1 (1,4-beta-N-acetylmuramidase)|nr:glycoside hydrolase [Neocallimastix sp. JGI-2020a]
MKFNKMYLFSIYFFIIGLFNHFVFVKANINIYSLCKNDIEGLCLPTEVCSTKGGAYISGVCSGDNDIKCCQNLPTPDFIKGIDISFWQNEIDYNKVEEAGIEFVIMRAMGSRVDVNTGSRIDTQFENNYSKVMNTKLKKGAYVYSLATNKAEMKKEIDELLEIINGKSFELPIYIDIEEESQFVMSKKELTEMIIYGCDLIKEKKYNAGIYIGCLKVEEKVIDVDLIKERGNEIWCARYHYDPSKHDFSDLATVFQYTNEGTVDGIEGNVDLDVRYTLNINENANKENCNCSESFPNNTTTENNEACDCGSDSTNNKNDYNSNSNTDNGNISDNKSNTNRFNSSKYFIFISIFFIIISALI